MIPLPSTIQKWGASLWHWTGMVMVYACCVLGLFYGGLKFHIPWVGANDFEAYSMVVDHPVSTPMNGLFFIVG